MSDRGIHLPGDEHDTLRMLCDDFADVFRFVAFSAAKNRVCDRRRQQAGRRSRPGRKGSHKVLGLRVQQDAGQRARVVSGRRWSVSTRAHRARQSQHEGLLRPGIRLPRRAPRVARVHHGVGGREFPERRHQPGERRARMDAVAAPETVAAIQRLDRVAVAGQGRHESHRAHGALARW